MIVHYVQDQLKSTFFLWQLFKLDHDKKKAEIELEEHTEKLRDIARTLKGIEKQIKEQKEKEAGLSKKKLLIQNNIKQSRKKGTNEVLEFSLSHYLLTSEFFSFVLPLAHNLICVCIIQWVLGLRDITIFSHQDAPYKCLLSSLWVTDLVRGFFSNFMVSVSVIAELRTSFEQALHATPNVTLDSHQFEIHPASTPDMQSDIQFQLCITAVPKQVHTLSMRQAQELIFTCKDFLSICDSNC